MAMTGDPIVAYPQTETGSIGVVFGKPNLHGLYDKLGITKDAVQRGKHADVESDYTPLTPEEREMLRRGVDESYRDFVNRVASARHRSFDQIEALAQGRVWLGDQAKERGLVDALGGLDTAIDLVKQKAKIPAAERVNLVMYPSRRSIVDVLLRRGTDDPLQTRLAQIFGRVPFHAWMKGGMLRVMPYWVTVQ
jgi:protease-4